MYVELKDINKTYAGYQASNHVSFGIEQGRLIALLGPSGSGKTTILRMIAGLETPDSGEIVIDGKVVNNIPASERGIGFVFQNYALFRYMTVYDNIAIPLYLSNCKNEDIHKRVRTLAASVGLQEILGKKAKFLSGGQKQRVAIARAISKHPLLILADEPTGSLDSKTAAEIMGLLKSIHKSGTTVVLVTHDMDIAASCERTVHMEDGVLSP